MMCLGATGCGRTDDTAPKPDNAGASASASAPASASTPVPASTPPPAPAFASPAATPPTAPPDEAEPDTGPIVQRLREQYADRLAGLYYAREQRRIVVRLTGTEPVAPQTHAVAGGHLQVVFEPGAAHSFAELNRIMSDSATRIDAALPTAHGRYVDERTGAIVVAIAPGSVGGKAKETELTQALGAPVRIEVEPPAVLQQQPAQR